MNAKIGSKSFCEAKFNSKLEKLDIKYRFLGKAWAQAFFIWPTEAYGSGKLGSFQL